MQALYKASCAAVAQLGVNGAKPAGPLSRQLKLIRQAIHALTLAKVLVARAAAIVAVS